MEMNYANTNETGNVYTLPFPNTADFGAKNMVNAPQMLEYSNMAQFQNYTQPQFYYNTQNNCVDGDMNSTYNCYNNYPYYNTNNGYDYMSQQVTDYSNCYGVSGYEMSDSSLAKPVSSMGESVLAANESSKTSTYSYNDFSLLPFSSGSEFNNQFNASEVDTTNLNTEEFGGLHYNSPEETSEYNFGEECKNEWSAECSNLSMVKLDHLSDKNLKSLDCDFKKTSDDDSESLANASTCESTPIMKPLRVSPPHSPMPSQFVSQAPVNHLPVPSMANVQDLSETQFYPPQYFNYAPYQTNFANQYDMTQFNNTMACYNTMTGYDVNGFSAMNGYDMSPAQGMAGYSTGMGYNNGVVMEGLDESIIEIANEIANNVQYLPDKDSNGKYSLDKNHPIHCVWRDVNRGHCSWRCRWWENGKRLSKNFNVKRFGEFEAMRMAITMKIRNSTPVERIQLLKEQREAVRNQLHLFGAYPNSTSYPTSNFNFESNFNDSNITKVMNDNKKLQKENWERLSWTYLKTNKCDDSNHITIICRLCSKTTRCSRTRNLQQAHIMHLIRMHKNPWKQYIDPNGLTKMCKLALDNLYERHRFTPYHQWVLRPGINRPEPAFV
ncbi:hypothetical protein TpMuguga_02g00497 [Theileria parva strain Muguga]|uniref:Uncharacterized protein n=1 Tax=Theileria parva TaxID=5875 RepID=Q4N4Z3_THEPA|nr:uncharacterized protein TpMuguga_02g00497 [Theileria parva strain Muguga]EAN32780.1 hypothetical protein TpMuguga_02g00497 [Theileria parva strain Muguga]|eukprot:XP_765063.1 hypothetical protein [Theileria parva strain Muguga]